MMRRLVVTTALGALAAAALLTSTATPAQPVLASVDTALSTYSQSANPPPATGKTCSKGFIAATIGGQPKCLAAGQQCQQAHAGDYTRYGFDCTKVGNRYQLKSHATSTAPAKLKPAPAKSKP